MKGSCFSQLVLAKVEVALGPYWTETQSPSGALDQLRLRLRTGRSKEHHDIFPGHSFCVPDVQKSKLCTDLYSNYLYMTGDLDKFPQTKVTFC
jgi:hypothetical protein